MEYKRLWLALTAVMVFSFSVLLYYGVEIYRKAPPIPEQVLQEDGTVLFTGQDIRDGQNVWQSMGGQEVGSIWGHGAYVAPDWTADWLHREAVFILNKWSQERFQKSFDELSEIEKAPLEAQLKQEMRTNTLSTDEATLKLSQIRVDALRSNSSHYSGLFMNDPNLSDLREAYAIPANTIRDSDRMRKMNAFFFWASWAAITLRPGESVTYTNNWPPDKLIGNEPTGSLMLWTGFSVIILLAGIGLLTFYYVSNRESSEEAHSAPTNDPLLNLKSTPSMRATLKYFWVVIAMMVAQVVLGVITAHYGVEGTAFYGFPLAEYLPYSVTRTWHIQLGILWIATSWLATGLFLAPAISDYEPKYQRLGVNFLFIALLVIVVGSMVGQWLGVMQRLDLVQNFWFGHQGYEYVDLGRFWQAFLFVGLVIWLILMVRAIAPAFRKVNEPRHLLALFMISCAAIAFFYAAGLMWGRQTNLAIAEYWRWWVVHLWVEGFFEVFATVAISFLFVKMGLLNARLATAAVLFSTVIFLFGGILGTFHHLYFTGTPTAVIAVGASFSALECVPLILIGFEAYHNLKLSGATPWVRTYKWPIYCFVAVAFWNFLGAGIFGFLINPPIALYYMQGLNTTPLHGHTALFGVYGVLGIGFMLFVLKALAPQKQWKEGVLSFSFWSINIGLLLMALLSLLPLGLLQTIASVEHGLWYARSAEFMQQPTFDMIRWLRVFGDTLFGIGSLTLGWFVVGLKTGHSIK